MSIPVHPLGRRSNPKILAVLFAGVLASFGATPLSAHEWPHVVATPFVSGLARPLGIVSAEDGSGRLFVLEQAGRIRVVRDGALRPSPFLDILSKTSCCGEQGLLGLAFPPGFASKRHFYVAYTDNAGDSILARYRVGSDPELADAASEEVLLTIAQPFDNHNGGHIAFGPDGFLYYGLGDGGSGGDPQGNGQNQAKLLGKMLRLDVESGAAPYAIPPSNPFVGVTGVRPEIWALGLRNPWRFSFDRETGDLWIGDVGQNAWEEIDFQPRASHGGENYGWRTMEGTHCYLPASCDSTGLTLPVAEYSHSVGCSVTGGFVARTPTSPRFSGTYLFGDYCSGTIWGLRKEGAVWESQTLLETSYSISTFGEDETGTLYVSDYGAGTIFRLAEDPRAFSADVSIIASANPPVGQVGSAFALTLRVANAGPNSATNVALSVSVPSGVAISGASFGGEPCSITN